jgi:VWFA-related protein
MMFDAAVQSGVSIYMLDPRGTAVAPLCTTAEFSGEGCGSDVRRAARAWAGQQSGMRTLAEETGGFAMLMSNSFDAFFDRIVNDNSAYYLIGYYSTNDRADGKYRSHDIKVTRRGLRTLHRAGYLAPSK